MKKKTNIPNDQENTRINYGITQDEDNPEWSEEDFARSNRAQDVLPEILGHQNADYLLKKKPGRPPIDNPKKRITVRLDADVVEWIKEQGPGYQTRINTILRNAMEQQ